MQHPQQAQFAPDPALPRGQGDLEALERLKEAIKNNQHEIFRATPRLDALASLYQGSLGALQPPPSLSVSHPEQIHSNPPEKAAAATMSSGGGFETVSPSGFSGDVRVQGAPLATAGPRPGISSNSMVRCLFYVTLSCSHVCWSAQVPPSPRDQTRNPSNGRAPVTPSRRSFRSPSVEHGTDVNGGATAHTGPNFLPASRPGTDSVFTPREQPSPRGDGQRIPQQMLTSPERRRSGADNDRTARPPPPIPSAYPSEHSRERPPALPPSREAMRPYDRERDWVREQQQHEIERPHERERRWSLSEQRRFDYDRRPLDNADRRPPSYDRRPPPHLDEKRPSGYVDRRPLDDRRFPPDYDRRPEESRFGIAPSQDIPTQEPHIANGSGDRRLSVSQTMKTGGPAPAPLASSSATPTSTTGTAAQALTPAPVDSAADRDISVRSSPAPMSVDGQRNSNTRFVVPVDERSSTQVASGTQPQLVPRAEPTRPGSVLLSSKPPENTGIATPAVVEPRVSEPPHPDRFSISAAPVTITTTTATDDRSRPVAAAASSHALREEPRIQPPPPQPQAQPRVSSPSLSLRAREPSRETQPSTFRSYFRPEFSRPSEDDRRLDMHPLPPPPPPADSFRRYDERGRWSPPPTTYADRRGGYRDYYDRDRDRDRDRERPYWDTNNSNNNNKGGYRSPPPPPRDRDRPHVPPSQPPPPPPPHWDRGRAARYSEAPYAPDRRFSDDRERSDRERAGWYAPPPPPPPHAPAPVPPASTFVGRPPPPFDNTPSSYVQRGPPGPRARSPSSPPPLKRARGEDGYAIPGPGASTAAAAAAAGVVGTGVGAPQMEYAEYAAQGVPIPVPIPIGMRAPERSPPRYAHAPHPHPHAHTHPHVRPMHMEAYGPYGGYEREGGGVRGPPPGAAYAREGPR
jgi:hypothetical protein